MGDPSRQRSHSIPLPQFLRQHHRKDCTMNPLAMLFGGALLAAGLSVGVYAHEGHAHKEGADDKQVTVTGELIDTACYVASDGDAKGKDHAECATKCMASGVPAGILPDGAKNAKELMYLLTNPTVLAPYAAQTIKVEGVAHGDLHGIDVKKLYVKQGESWKEVQLKDEHHKMAEGDKDQKPGDKPKDDMGGMKMDHGTMHGH
jgi:hypothetical protein